MEALPQNGDEMRNQEYTEKVKQVDQTGSFFARDTIRIFFFNIFSIQKFSPLLYPIFKYFSYSEIFPTPLPHFFIFFLFRNFPHSSTPFFYIFSSQAALLLLWCFCSATPPLVLCCVFGIPDTRISKA
jgi:hypothetical protein